MDISLLDQWKKSWIGEKNVALWGYGKTCRYFLSDLKKTLNIEYIIDNDKDKEGTVVDDVPIIHPDSIDLHGKRIIVTTYYQQICQQLKQKGLREFIDFCDIRMFISGKSWFEYNKVILNELHISITTACTLNCKYCNMYMPFHKKSIVTYSFEEVKSQIDLLFRFTDKVVKLVLLGGEPLVNRDLSKIIEYIYSAYPQKFDLLEIITNATIIPDEQILKAFRNPGIIINISNYNLNAAYTDKLNKIKDILDKNNINTIINTDLQWKDFSFPYSGLGLSDEQADINMHKCNPDFRGFNDSKFYFCHLVWSADKAGLFKERSSDYVDLGAENVEESDKKEKMVLMNMCCFDRCYNSLCKECGGCSDLNQKYISVGEQICNK